MKKILDQRWFYYFMGSVIGLPILFTFIQGINQIILVGYRLDTWDFCNLF